MDKRVFLKVKIASLEAEAKIIRAEADRWRSRAKRSRASVTHPGEHVESSLFLVQQLNAHRVTELRREARAALLAYAFIRGKAWRDVEPTNNPLRKGPDWDRVGDMVKRFGGYGRNAELLAWIKAGELAEPPAVT